MEDKKLELINEQSSPLFRIMSVYNDNDSSRRQFDNNICAFHIGDGYVLTVAHNLRSVASILHSISEDAYQKQIAPNLDPTQVDLFNRCYILDGQTNKRYLSNADQKDVQQLINALNQINYDTRWITLYQKQICKPFLIVQFRNNKFYNDSEVTQKINPNHIFHEPPLSRYTFILELELVNAFYSDDIALYRIINTDQSIIDIIPSSEIDFKVHDKSNGNCFCLQSAPADNLGRLLNSAEIEGLLDHHSTFQDRFAGNYVMDGLRYLIKGYFRFGSSGAPYFIYDAESKSFKFNAIQSEASPIQLSINNNRDGNFQYVNAIATPLKNVEDELKSILSI